MKIVDLNKDSATVSVDDLASQLTLIDLAIFKQITKDEIANLGYSSPSASQAALSSSSSSSSSCSSSNSSSPLPPTIPDCDKNEFKQHHNKQVKTKQQLLPNVVAMNKQFNQVTFWIVDQILSHQSARSRAELISHLTKTAKRLFELNNLHSSYAFVSALQSAPIYRLDKTWQILRKKYPKEELIFNKLIEFFSDTNNYEALRLHLKTCRLPCIPYLGLYSRDIIYIKEAFREGSLRRANGIKKISDSIIRFQTSEYEELKYLPKLSELILSHRYIGQLQKTAQDESYRRSLQLEPPSELLNNKKGVFEILIHNLISNKYG